jgi:hypothetical protein
LREGIRDGTRVVPDSGGEETGDDRAIDGNLEERRDMALGTWLIPVVRRTLPVTSNDED